MRLQLTARRRTRPRAASALKAGSLLAAAALLPTAAWADADGAARVTFFREPSSKNKGLTVIHPQGDLTGTPTRDLRLSAGYEVDIVSGATPGVFGPATGVDAVTGATTFSDQRHAARGGFEFTRNLATFSAGYSYGFEKDYRSHTVSAGAKADILERNFTLGLSFSHNFDTVCNNDNRAAQSPLDLKPLSKSDGCFKNGPGVVTESVAIDALEPSLTWTVTPRFVLQGGGTAQIVDGFQANPYRAVLVGSQHRTPQEHLPALRQRYAAFLRGALAFPGSRASVTTHLRLYRDSWAVQAATAELLLQKYLGNAFLVGLRTRAHAQQEASFYRTSEGYRTLGPAGRYWTGDRELSPMGNFLAGARFSFLHRKGQEPGILQELEVTGKLEYLLYFLDSTDAPNADRRAALIGQMAMILRF